MKMQIHSLPLGAAFVVAKKVSPVTLYTMQHCAHKHCFTGRINVNEDQSYQSLQISITQRRGLEKLNVERIVLDSLCK